MYKPDLNEVKALAGEYGTIPVSCSIYSDIRTPVEVLRMLKKISRHCYILESLEDSTRWGRYTFLGYDPLLRISCTNGVITIDAGTKTVIETDDPGKYIRQILDKWKSPRFQYLPPFTGGLVGYFSYDYIKYAEPVLKLNTGEGENFKDMDLMLYDKVIAYDNLKQEIILIVNIKTDEPEKNYVNALLELERMTRLIKTGTPGEPAPLQLKSEFRPMFDEATYCDMVEKAKRYIYEGEIFQVVLSNCLEADAEGSLLDTYRVLRTTNPSPYMFYFSGDDFEIAGASPETLVKLRDGIVHTFPLAGTRPRGKTDDEDAQLERELLSDPKELAEHNMLVDLGRNDIGKVSKYGTVEVEKYLAVLRFSHVMHLGSSVRGEIREDKNALDTIIAVLPAGTLSGAPKIRACEIINELEKSKRGIYGGAIGYIDFTGNMDTCIAIRTAIKINGKVYVRSGAGIVADSVPAAEYHECVNKAQAVINALKISEGGIDR